MRQKEGDGMNRTCGTWKVRRTGLQEWSLFRYNRLAGKEEFYRDRFDMRMFATEKARELNRMEKEKSRGKVQEM